MAVPEEYQIVEQAPTTAEYLDLRRAVGWRVYAEAQTAQSLANTLFWVCALRGQTVVGCARVIGDRALYYYVQDVIVHPRHQRRQLATQMMAAVMRHLRATATDGAFIGLMAAKGVAGFYEQFGFQQRGVDRPGMEIWVKAVEC